MSEADRAAAAADVDPVVIIGAGLIGASIGCALTSQHVEVYLDDKERSHTMVAATRGAGIVAKPNPRLVRLVVVAVPPAAIPDVVEASLRRYPNAVVTDVGSVKGMIRAELEARGVDLTRYVGSHPMAGTQFAGPLTAVAELFVDRTWVITPAEVNPAWCVQRVHALIALCGARMVERSPFDHDRAVAEVSHLPQLMSSLTAARLRDVPAEDLQLAGQGVRDVTRVAASDPALWRQIIGANRDQVLIQLRAVRDDIDRLVETLADPDEVADVLDRGRTGARALRGKHGRDLRDMVAVVVEIPDTPGALARLFSDIDAAGVNVEDVSIEHDPQREAGFLSVEVTHEKSDVLRDAMRSRGWSVRT